MNCGSLAPIERRYVQWTINRFDDLLVSKNAVLEDLVSIYVQTPRGVEQLENVATFFGSRIVYEILKRCSGLLS